MPDRMTPEQRAIAERIEAMERARAQIDVYRQLLGEPSPR